ncbi:hypothetical protein RUM43_011936 [Polyplax serrata]|uniref:TOG domain-containing protein n=1 Tax=Polyplax serrata TaxID=468196 RepID=A0AAN8PIY4_POLSC
MLSLFQVSQKGLEIMTSLTDRMKHDFKPYVPTVCPAVVDRLVTFAAKYGVKLALSQTAICLKIDKTGRIYKEPPFLSSASDSHESVREKAQALLMVILEKEVLTPQQLFDRVTYSFSHKNSKVREEIMICLVNTINMYGSNAIALNKLTPHLVKLLADQNMHVREQALATLMEIYRRVGDRLRTDIQKKYASTINPSRVLELDDRRNLVLLHFVFIWYIVGKEYPCLPWGSQWGKFNLPVRCNSPAKVCLFYLAEKQIPKLAPLMAKMDELRESGAVATTTVDGEFHLTSFLSQGKF